MKPDFSKMTKEEIEAHKAATIAARQAPSFRPMSSKQISKMESRNAVVAPSDETHYEMLQRNAKNNLPSSLR